ncbi:MAG: GGDEF domain-containing protein [Candidatus Woesearchaeota archaeon]
MANTGNRQLDDILEEEGVVITPENRGVYTSIADVLNGKDKSIINAGKDPLTKLYRTGKMYEEMQTHLALTQREGHDFSIAIGDIDDFKLYNDTYGHTQANQVLSTSAKIMLSSKRPSDFVVRYGGEEFVILMPETDAEDAVTVIERIRSNIAETFMPINPKLKNDQEELRIAFPDENYRHITMSFGIVTYHKKFNQVLGFSAETDKADALIDLADAALYGAKGKKNVPAGLTTPKNCTCTYSISDEQVFLSTL